MSSPKAKTLIEKMGFNDPDLTTPEHDEMFITCMSSAQTIIDFVVEHDERFSNWRRMKENLESGDLCYGADNGVSMEPYIPFAYDEYLYNVASVVPEKPVVTKNNFIVGFIDMFVRVKLGTTMIGGAESPFKSYRMYGDFYDDRFERAMIENVYDTHLDKIVDLFPKFDIMIEIKPMIRSVGELIRQVQTYRQYSKGNVVFVVLTKTNGFKDVLEKSGIMLVNYSDVLANVSDSK